MVFGVAPKAVKITFSELILHIIQKKKKTGKSTKVLQGSLFRGRILFLGQVSVDIYGCQKAGLEGWFRRLWQCNFLLLISSMIMQSTKQSSCFLLS